MSSASAAARIRVLIVDDSAIMRKLVAASLSSAPEIEIVGYASSGEAACREVATLKPDLVTMDVEMPGLNGIETVRALRQSHPRLRVIMLSTLTREGAAIVLEALLAGANDYVTKPTGSLSPEQTVQHLAKELLPKIRALVLPPIKSSAPRSKAPPLSPSPTSPAKQNKTARLPPRRFHLVVIGSSTGGPNALAEVFSKIPRTFPLPIVIVQHMPPMFTKVLAERLDKESPLSFCEGAHGQICLPGHVYLAPGGYHVEVHQSRGQFQLHLQQEPPEQSCRPSVDVLFRSAAQLSGVHTLGVVLTGMGRDGCASSAQIKERGGWILAQNQATSVVWGMPGSVVEAGLADEVLPLGEMAEALLRLTRTTPKS
jgi:two-component system, chemotaxis family, protein-glutamate methylesterase/glutaminase